MKIQFTSHARKRMLERDISERIIKEALNYPTKVLYDNSGRLLMKKLYTKERKQRLLMIAVEIQEDTFLVITVIDTSKVEKYL